MKQRITVKQLNELSEKGKKKLRKWCEENIPVDMSEARTAILPTKQELTGLYNRKLEDTMFLSIGQMIEFLWEVDRERVSIHTTDSDGWEVMDDLWEVKSHSKGELCDALWQAVKEVLNK